MPRAWIGAGTLAPLAREALLGVSFWCRVLSLPGPGQALVCPREGAGPQARGRFPGVAERASGPLGALSWCTVSRSDSGAKRGRLAGHGLRLNRAARSRCACAGWRRRAAARPARRLVCHWWRVRARFVRARGPGGLPAYVVKCRRCPACCRLLAVRLFGCSISVYQTVGATPPVVNAKRCPSGAPGARKPPTPRGSFLPSLWRGSGYMRWFS